MEERARERVGEIGVGACAVVYYKSVRQRVCHSVLVCMYACQSMYVFMCVCVCL